MEDKLKKIISQILLLSLLTVIFSCNNYGTYIMPTFRPLDNTADIVFIENTRWLAQETEIIAINTKTIKAEQIYRFNARFFKNFVRTTDNNICYFSFYSYIVGLNTLTGKCFEIYNEPIWDNNIHNENLYFTNDYDHTQTFCYNPNTIVSFVRLLFLTILSTPFYLLLKKLPLLTPLRL